MDRKSKLLYLILAILIALSVTSLFYKGYILQDFEIMVFEGDE